MSKTVQIEGKSIREKVVVELQSSKRPVTASEVASKIGHSQPAVRAIMLKLLDEGRVELAFRSGIYVFFRLKREAT